MFEAQAAARPHATALISAGRSITYRQLDERANRLGRYLRRRGVGRGSLVGLCLPRCPELLVAILATLKAGGAWVPLDPGYPPDRLRFMTRDTNTGVILAGDERAGELAEADRLILRLDDALAESVTEDAARLDVAITPDDLMYVIYTSGSTGRPKGVLVHHGGVVNLARGFMKLFDLSEADRVLLYYSPSFDGSVAEMVMGLLPGGTLCIGPDQRRGAGAVLAAALRDDGITVAALPPAVLHHLPADGLESLRVLIAAGERCTPGVVSRWAPGRRLFNVYGTTETSIASTAHLCQAKTSKPPVGQPLPGVDVHVLNDDLEPVPLGDDGEVFIGGAQVAQGYWNRPGLTAERFIPDPHGGSPGGRLYRTGDCARWLPDGSLDFIGRADDQVKVRGFRIELGEIEAALSAHPAVRQAVVVAHESQASDTRLIAYVVGEAVPTDDLRKFLSARLPGHMLPASYLQVEALPVTVNGKIDRRRLPVPDKQRPSVATPYTEPRSLSEKRVAGIWADILRVHPVGVHDDFFELGGDSLLCLRAAARLEEAFGITVSPQTLFEKLTVAEFVDALESTIADRADSIEGPTKSAQAITGHRTDRAE